MFGHRRLAAACAALASLLAEAPAAQAQDFPNRPVRVIGSTAPGGLSDVFIRAVADEWQKRVGQPLVIENRPGGAFNIAARLCTGSPPDGYTICLLPGEPLTFNPFLFKSLPFDPVDGFQPISHLFYLSASLIVSSSLGVKTLPELVAYSKAKPGSLSYTAPALSQWVLVEKFKEQTGADLIRVPFRGGGEALTAVLSGATPLMWLGGGPLYAQLEAGTIFALLTDTDKRNSRFPHVPTVGESGIRMDYSRSYFGLLAPPGTPKAIATKIRDEIAAIASDPGFRERNMFQRGLEPVMSTPDEFAEFIKRDRVIAERVVRASGLQPQ